MFVLSSCEADKPFKKTETGRRLILRRDDLRDLERHYDLRRSLGTTVLEVEETWDGVRITKIGDALVSVDGAPLSEKEPAIIRFDRDPIALFVLEFDGGIRIVCACLAHKAFNR